MTSTWPAPPTPPSRNFTRDWDRLASPLFFEWLRGRVQAAAVHSVPWDLHERDVEDWAFVKDELLPARNRPACLDVVRAAFRCARTAVGALRSSTGDVATVQAADRHFMTDPIQRQCWDRSCLGWLIGTHDTTVVHCALVDQEASGPGDAYLARLEFELFPAEGGFDYLPRHPLDTFLPPPDGEFDRSLQHALRAAKYRFFGDAPTKRGARWRLLRGIDHAPIARPAGSSAGGAAVYGLYHALRGECPDDGVIVMASLAHREPPELTGVGSLAAKVRAVITANEAARAAGAKIDTIVTGTADDGEEVRHLLATIEGERDSPLGIRVIVRGVDLNPWRAT